MKSREFFPGEPGKEKSPDRFGSLLIFSQELSYPGSLAGAGSAVLRFSPSLKPVRKI
jgi:hypothetical protein